MQGRYARVLICSPRCRCVCMWYFLQFHCKVRVEMTAFLFSQRLQKLWKKKRAPLYTEYLQDWQRDLKSCADKCAGALCVPLLEDGMIAWFRPEVGVTTLWGSSLETNYAKQNEMYAHVKFGVYLDDGKEKSAPWLKWEVEAADGVGALVGGVLGSDDDGVVGLLKKIRCACTRA